MKSVKFFLMLCAIFNSTVIVKSAECKNDEECVSYEKCLNGIVKSRNPSNICSIGQLTEVCCKTSEMILITTFRTTETTTSRTAETTTSRTAKSFMSRTSCGANDVVHSNLNLINSKICGVSHSDRVLGGEEAAKYQFPWLGILKFKSTDDENFQSSLCSGTLISPRYVLTAAHCFRETNYKLFSVRFGEHKISDSNDSTIEDVPVEGEPIIHENYNNAKKINDIALVRLARDVQITRETVHVNTICLPVNETQNIDNLEGDSLKLMIAGWGKTENSETKSDVLMKAVVDYLPHDICAEKYEELRNEPESLVKIIIDNSHLCAGGNLQVDTCKGDSGGGIQGIANFNQRPRIFQHGIVSFGIDCSRIRPVPGVYTRVSEFMCWILDNMTE